MTGKENAEQLAFEVPPERFSASSLSDNTSIETPTRKPLAKINMDSPFNPAQGQPTPTPKKGSSSRVIETLHGEIDELKDDLFKVKNRNDELKKANEIIKKRRDQLVEQISNVKHENETVHSLLERKQRRITDLETQLTESMSSTDDLNFRVKSLQARCDKLQRSEMSSVAEYERTKIAYDTIITSQKQYREHYTKEIETLREQLQTFIATKDAEITKNIGLINKSDATIYRSIKSITIRSNDIEAKYQKRDEDFAKTIASMKSITISNKKDSEVLLKASKELFLEIANTLNIDHTDLLESYLKESEDKRDPFNEDAEEIPEETVTDVTVETENDKDDQPTEPVIHDEIKIKKRQDKKNDTARSSSNTSLEFRMSSLGKELNSSIPITDRDTKVDLPSKIPRSKSLRKVTRNVSSTPSSHHNNAPESRRSSRIFDTDNNHDETGSTTSKSNNSSRHSSKIYEKSTSRRTSMIYPVSELKQDSSHFTLEIHDANNPDGQGQKKKRRRRRKRRTNQGGDIHEDSEDDGEHSGVDESS